MKEIKFRTWDGMRMTFNGVAFSNSGGFLFAPSNQVLMQFTGLHDKNAKEIYEGDILKPTFGSGGIVTFSDGGFVLEEPGLGSVPASMWQPHWKVIGNAYEHPDLISSEATKETP